MRIVPVLDLLQGRVVRGVAGRRDEYRPIESRLTEGCDPLTIAEAIQAHFGLDELYVADLDAIQSGVPNLSVLRSLSNAGFSLMVDAGIRRAEDAEPIVATGAGRIVAGLETLAGPRELARLVDRWGGDRVVFSLDLRDGRPLGDRFAWPEAEPLAITRRAIEAGCTRLIVLDIARVGTASGVPTLALCGAIRKMFPQTSLITGGGIRGIDDLRLLGETGIDAVLIASALHNGSVTPDSITQFRQLPI